MCKAIFLISILNPNAIAESHLESMKTNDREKRCAEMKLVEIKQSMRSLRGQEHEWEGIEVLITLPAGSSAGSPAGSPAGGRSESRAYRTREMRQQVSIIYIPYNSFIHYFALDVVYT